MMPPPAPMQSTGPPGNYGGGPPRGGGYNSGMGRDRGGPPRFNDRAFQDSGENYFETS